MEFKWWPPSLSLCQFLTPPCVEKIIYQTKKSHFFQRPPKLDVECINFLFLSRWFIILLINRNTYGGLQIVTVLIIFRNDSLIGYRRVPAQNYYYMLMINSKTTSEVPNGNVDCKPKKDIFTHTHTHIHTLWPIQIPLAYRRRQAPVYRL